MQQRLNLVRSTIRKAAPQAEEAISYGIVGYKVNGKPLVYFGGFAKHYSMFGGTGQLREMFQQRLKPYLGGKGTIQFPLELPVPVDLVREVTLMRLEEVASGGPPKRKPEKARKPAKKPAKKAPKKSSRKATTPRATRASRKPVKR